MAKEKPSIPKGTRDFGPLEVKKRRYILNTIETVFKKYGFMPLETPSMENLSVLEGKYGDEGDNLLFRILNSGDYLKNADAQKLENRDSKGVTNEISEKGLRYDLTVPFARYVVMHQNEITFPFRRYQMQPVWRADRPQKGRYREFWQCDADVVGSDNLLCELDLIQIYDEVFRKLGIAGYELRVNHRKILQGIAEEIGAVDRLADLTVILDKTDKIGVEGVRAELTEKGFDINNSKLLSDLLLVQSDKVSFIDDLSKEQRHLSNTFFLQSINTVNDNFVKGRDELSFITHRINQSTNQPINLKIDFSLARGLSYYTGCIFEVVVTDERCSLKSSIGGGGRYDNLTGNFGLPSVSGVGISFGLDRIYDVMEELDLFPKDVKASDTRILFCYFDETGQQYCLPALAQLRHAGIAAEIYPDVVKKFGKQLDYANKLHIPFAAIAGENEMKEGKFMLKDLTAGTQQLISIEEIIRKANADR